MNDRKLLLQNEKTSVSVIGTGEFGAALAKRMILHGYDVTIGSGNPQNRVFADEPLSSLRVVSIPDCIAASKIIFLAIQEHHHADIYRYSNELEGKILVDVSNTHSTKRADPSNASRLSSRLPQTAVIKAFNTVSAYSIENDFETPGVVYVCGSDDAARSAVATVARGAGFPAVEIAGLENARGLELKNQRCCWGDWARATIVMMIVFIPWFTYVIIRYYHMRSSPYTPERFPVNVMNKTYGVVSLTLLAITYIPGSLAALHQLCYGTKHSRFPKFLDQWMKIRKQLGLYAMTFAILHMIISLGLTSPTYFSSLYHTTSHTVPAGVTIDTEVPHGSRMNWIGETAMCLGIVSVGCMIVLGITSLKDVARRLNPVQWKCLHTYLGVFGLITSTAHPMVMGVPKWLVETPDVFLSRLTFTSCVLPWFAILLKIIVLMPCVQWRLDDIRNGRVGESGSKAQISPEAGMRSVTATPRPVSSTHSHQNGSYVADNTGF